MNIGDRIGDYEVVRVIGAGGMGQVYEVRNTLSERTEAMKVALSNLEGSQEALERFQREIKVQAALDHPNIAKLYTAMRYGNQLLMFMVFVDGESLSKLIELGPMPVASVLDCARQALDALGYAHSKGVVHRDIKPANIMQTTNGVVKLMDFGIARAKTDRKLTQTGTAVGSLFYMSPEQIRGSEPDARSDLYSFGITLYELVTGRRPFAGNSDFQIMSAHLQESPAPPIDVASGVPGDLSDIILMAIAKDPEARFQSAQALQGALANISVSGVQTARFSGTTPSMPVSGARDSPIPEATVAMVTRSQPPVLASTPLPTPPVVTKPASHRGMYMALGSVATVAILAGAIIFGPKLFKSGSADAQSPQISASVPAALPTQAATQASPAPTIAAPSPVTQAAPAGTTTNTNTIPLRQAVPAAPAAPLTAQPAAQIRRPAISQTLAQQPVAQPPASQQPVAQQPVPQPTPPLSAQPAAAPVQAPPVQVRPAVPPPELAELRERYNFVAIRASTAKAGLSPIEQKLAGQGFGLRADIREARERVDYLMQESMASIRAGDVEGGKRNLLMAERALASIEKFLGR